MEQVFIANEGLVKKIAYKFSVQYRVDYEEAYSEAALAFVKYYPNFDETKAKFSTYMWHCMWGQLQKWVRGNKVNHVELNEECFHVETEEKLEFENLSEVASYAVQMAIGDLSDLVDTAHNSACHIRAGIRRVLNELGYSQRIIDKAFAEINAALA